MKTRWGAAMALALSCAPWSAWAQITGGRVGGSRFGSANETPREERGSGAPSWRGGSTGERTSPAPIALRIARAREKLGDDPRVVITDLEARLGTRATIDTLRRLQALYPGVRFVWIMGADNLVQFHRWRNWRQIMARVPVAVMASPGAGLAARLSVTARAFRGAQVAAPDLLTHRKAPVWAFVNMPLHTASSSVIRARGEWRR